MHMRFPCPGGGRSASVMDAGGVGVKPPPPTPPPRIRAATTLPLQSTSDVSDVDQLIMPNPGTPGFGGRVGVLRCACVEHFRISPAGLAPTPCVPLRPRNIRAG